MFRSKSQFYSLIVERPLAGCLSSPILNFLICKMGLIIEPSSQSVCGDQSEHEYKVFSTVPGPRLELSECELFLPKVIYLSFRHLEIYKGSRIGLWNGWFNNG